MSFGWLEQWEGGLVSCLVECQERRVVARNPLLFCTEHSAESTACAHTGGLLPAPPAAAGASEPLMCCAEHNLRTHWWPSPRSAPSCCSRCCQPSSHLCLLQGEWCHPGGLLPALPRPADGQIQPGEPAHRPPRAAVHRPALQGCGGRVCWAGPVLWCAENSACKWGACR